MSSIPPEGTPWMPSALKIPTKASLTSNGIWIPLLRSPSLSIDCKSVATVMLFSTIFTLSTRFTALTFLNTVSAREKVQSFPTSKVKLPSVPVTPFWLPQT